MLKCECFEKICKDCDLKKECNFWIKYKEFLEAEK